MFTFKRKTAPIYEATKGRVYVFRLTIGGEYVYKVGMCHSDRTTDRFMEVLKSYFTTYRYVPEAKILKFKEFENPLLVEKHLHKELEEYRYRFPKKFDGHTEFFSEIDINYLLEYIENFTYEQLLDCTTIPEEEYKAIQLLITEESTEEEIPF